MEVQDLFATDKTVNRELEDHLESIIAFLQENRSEMCSWETEGVYRELYPEDLIYCDLDGSAVHSWMQMSTCLCKCFCSLY